MHYIAVGAGGSPDDLNWTTGPDPQPSGSDLLIRVAAAGLNRADSLQRQGKYPPPAGASEILGMEVSGIVEACGPEAAGWRRGDTVCALVPGGGYAELCLASPELCLPVPAPLTVVDAAALPEALFTAWDALFIRGRLTAGETALIHGGSGGVGTTAIQLAAALGAIVYTTAGSDDRCARCTEVGAAGAVNYRTTDFVERTKEWTSGRGVDVILDVVGADYFPRNIEALATEGRLIHLRAEGPMSRGTEVQMSLATLMSKRLGVFGCTLRNRSVPEKARISVELRERVWPLLESGALKPVASAKFPMARASEAHRLLESGEYFGKILLTL